MSKDSQVSILSVLVRDDSEPTGLLGVCAGYESGVWRYQQLADFLMELLPEFCLNYSEFRAIEGSNAVSMIKQAAGRVYDTAKFQRRGEFGELMLHAIIRQEFETLPAVSKIYYKDANNETVKGFDAVHVVVEEDGLGLWLGECKFYTEIGAAIRDVTDELQAHTKVDYLRREFVAIQNKIDDKWPHASDLKKLLHANTSLDEVFARLCIPVLLTYDSAVVGKHKRDCEEYREEIVSELREHFASFCEKDLPKVRIYLLLLPMATKEKLILALHEKLVAWRQV